MDRFTDIMRIKFNSAELQTAGSDEFVMPTSTQDPDALGTNVLSVALIGPEEQRRKAVASALAGLAGKRDPGVLTIRNWTMCRVAGGRVTTSSSWSWTAIPSTRWIWWSISAATAPLR